MNDDVEFYLRRKLPWLLHITPESVNQVLADFPVGNRRFSDRWLAGQVRIAFSKTVDIEFERYPGKFHVRRELDQIVSTLNAAIEQIESRSGWSERVLRRYSFMSNKGERLQNYYEAISADLTELEKNEELYKFELSHHGTRWADESIRLARAKRTWRSFRDQVNAIYSLRAFINDAMSALCSNEEPPRWRDRERRKQRIELACQLSAVFEVAFGTRATVNNWANDEGQPKLGHWPDFFARIGGLALKLDRIPDFHGILKEARRKYKNDRVEIFKRDFPDEKLP